MIRLTDWFSIIFLFLMGTFNILANVNARYMLRHSALWTDPQRHYLCTVMKKIMTSAYRWGGVCTVLSVAFLPIPATTGSKIVLVSTIYLSISVILSYRTKKLVEQMEQLNK